MLKALLLDLDGTLVDTPQAIVDVAQATLAALGREPALGCDQRRVERASEHNIRGVIPSPACLQRCGDRLDLRPSAVLRFECLDRKQTVSRARCQLSIDSST